MDQETHSYQVSVWTTGNDKPNSIFEKGFWMEMCRCITKNRAEEIALCLSLRHAAVCVSHLVNGEDGARWVPYKFIPETAKGLK